jgi:tetraacyldisaccharide 4'-kinase
MTLNLNKKLKSLLKPASYAYGLGAYCRLQAYASHILKQSGVNIPVVSVGNLTVGGTGKTPLTIDIAKQFVDAGYKPAILSRGYKRKSKAVHIIVSDGTTIKASCEDAGDEPFLIALRVPEAIVIVGSKRVDTAKIAIEELKANILILDDGFQHVALRRDHDIVLLDYNEDLTEDSLLPAGRLREPLAALNRANSILITKVPAKPDLERLERLGAIAHTHSPKSSLGLISFSPNHVSSWQAEARLFNTAKLDILKGRKAFAFCALAKSNPFFISLKNAGLNIVGQRAFSDHHWYSEKDCQKILLEAEKSGAELLLTTEKDLVKLEQFAHTATKPLYAIGLTTNWIGPKPVYLTTLLTQNKL